MPGAIVVTVSCKGDPEMYFSVICSYKTWIEMIDIRHWETGKAVLYVESSKPGNLPFVGTGEVHSGSRVIDRAGPGDGRMYQNFSFIMLVIYHFIRISDSQQENGLLRPAGIFPRTDT